MAFRPIDFNIIQTEFEQRFPNGKLFEGKNFNYIKLVQHGLSYSMTNSDEKLLKNNLFGSWFRFKLKSWINSKRRKVKFSPPKSEKILIVEGRRKLKLPTGEEISPITHLIRESILSTEYSWWDTTGAFENETDFSLKDLSSWFPRTNEIQNEIDTSFAAGNLTVSNIPKLEFLERFIMEVMRIAPIAHTHVRQVKTSFEHDTFQFRAGDILLLSVFAYNHDPGNWTEPDKFLPERFANKNLASLLFPFGLGKHTCPGKYLAYQDILIVLVSLLQKFKIKALTSINLDACSSLLLEPLQEQSIELIPR